MVHCFGPPILEEQSYRGRHLVPDALPVVFFAAFFALEYGGIIGASFLDCLDF